MNASVFGYNKLRYIQKLLFLLRLCWEIYHLLGILFSMLPKSRVGTRRGALLPFFECLPPNPACYFHSTGLSSIIRVILPVNVIALFVVVVLHGDPGDTSNKERAFFDDVQP
jgi:hypothetical protein